MSWRPSIWRSEPRAAIIAGSHSPYLLDWLNADEIRLMTIGPNSYATCGKLTDHPQFDKWKDEMAPGELWSMFGEKWLAGAGNSNLEDWQ